MTAVWAFARPVDSQKLVYESVKAGKSRFGWSGEDCHNLKEKGWSDHHSRQQFLLQIKPGDWIVHVNCPSWGKCVAVPVEGEYDFDEGLPSKDWDSGRDFRHFIPVKGAEHVDFDRRDPGILPTVNLNPRSRYHRVYAVDDFLRSVENVRQGKVVLEDGELRELHHLRRSTPEILARITGLIHQTHKGKNLELLLAKIFERVPNVVEVKKNGFGWRSDHGADLIVSLRTPVANLEFENKIVVQIKSFGGDHYDLSAIGQIKTAIKHYNASAGMIITTAQKTEQLDTAVTRAAEEIGVPIDLLAGDDVAKFFLQHGPDVIFDISTSS